MAMSAATPTTVLLVRHGETEWNTRRRIQGQGDSALTTRGERQAALLADRLAGTCVDEVYSSDLGRALRTAEAIARPHGLKPVVHRGLRERCFGRWEGLTLDEAGQDDPVALETWERDLEHFRPPGAESSKELRRRVWDAFEGMVGGCDSGRIVVVTHSGPIRQILATALDIPWPNSRRLRIANASVTALQMHADGVMLLTFSDTCHLEPAEHGRQGS